MYNSQENRNSQGIRLVRVGGLSPVKQTNDAAPEKKGVWAFIWTMHDVFFLGSTNPEGVSSKSTRYDQLKREGWRKFIHSDELYTRIKVPGSEISSNGFWYKTNGIALAKYMPKHYANTLKSLRKESKDFRHSKMNPWNYYSKDNFEVFVPRPNEKSW